MSGFSKFIAGSHAKKCPYQAYDFTARILEQYDRFLTPTYSPKLQMSFDLTDPIDCGCLGHDEKAEVTVLEVGSARTQEVGQESGRGGGEAGAEGEKIKCDEPIFRSIEVRSRHLMYTD